MPESSSAAASGEASGAANSGSEVVFSGALVYRQGSVKGLRSWKSRMIEITADGHIYLRRNEADNKPHKACSSISSYTLSKEMKGGHKCLVMRRDKDANHSVGDGKIVVHTISEDDVEQINYYVSQFAKAGMKLKEGTIEPPPPTVVEKQPSNEAETTSSNEAIPARVEEERKAQLGMLQSRNSVDSVASDTTPEKISETTPSNVNTNNVTKSPSLPENTANTKKETQSLAAAVPSRSNSSSQEQVSSSSSSTPQPPPTTPPHPQQQQASSGFDWSVFGNFASEVEDKDRHLIFNSKVNRAVVNANKMKMIKHTDRMNLMVFNDCLLFAAPHGSHGSTTLKPENVISLIACRVKEALGDGFVLHCPIAQYKISFVNKDETVERTKQLEEAIIATMGDALNITQNSPQLPAPNNISTTTAAASVQPLAAAAAQGITTTAADGDAVAALGRKGSTQSNKDMYGWQHQLSSGTLHHAAIVGDTPGLSKLISEKADVNQVDDSCCTALHIASHCGRSDMCKLLLQHKADILATDALGQTPLHVATRTGRTEAAKLLCEASKESVDLMDFQGQTPLCLAVSLSDESAAVSLTRLLLKMKASTATVNAEGKSILEIAATKGHQPVISLILGMDDGDDEEEDHQQQQSLGKKPSLTPKSSSNNNDDDEVILVERSDSMDQAALRQQEQQQQKQQQPKQQQPKQQQSSPSPSQQQAAKKTPITPPPPVSSSSSTTSTSSTTTSLPSTSNKKSHQEEYDELMGPQQKQREKEKAEAKARAAAEWEAELKQAEKEAVVSAQNAAAEAKQRLEERGQKLNKLKESMDAVGNEAANFGDFAKQLAERERKKKWWQL